MHYENTSSFTFEPSLLVAGNFTSWTVIVTNWLGSTGNATAIVKKENIGMPSVKLAQPIVAALKSKAVNEIAVIPGLEGCEDLIIPGLNFKYEWIMVTLHQNHPTFGKMFLNSDQK